LGKAPDRVYLDDAGAAPTLPEVAEALRNVPGGNPSSLHAEGRAARAALDGARDHLAAALNDFVREGDVVITIGAGDITQTGPELKRQLESRRLR